MIVSVQSARFIAFNHSCCQFFVWQWQQVCDQISNLRLYYIDSGTQHHNKMIFKAPYVAESVLVWMGHLQFSLCFCLQLALWHRPYMTLVTCGWPSRASLRNQQANQKIGLWILIRQAKIDLFLVELLRRAVKIYWDGFWYLYRKYRFLRTSKPKI